MLHNFRKTIEILDEAIQNTESYKAVLVLEKVRLRAKYASTWTENKEQ